jgi:hypothetical protein
MNLTMNQTMNWTMNQTFNLTANMTMNQTMLKGNISIFAGSMVPSNVGGAVIVAPNSTGLNNLTWVHVDFPNGSRTNVTFPVIMPTDYNSGTITYQYWWAYSGSAATTTVTMGLSGWCAADNTALSTIPGTAVEVTDTAQDALSVLASPISGAVTLGGSPAPNALCWLTLYRNGGSLATSAHIMALRAAYGIS